MEFGAQLKPMALGTAAIRLEDEMEDSVHEHFVTLRGKINARLVEIRSPVADEQANDYPWLYGALGVVPADSMFICETPSLTPIRREPHRTPDGGPTGIEKQWWGGERNPAAKRFRQALYETGLKTTPPGSPDGWRCYITNVIKEANIAGHQEARGQAGRLIQARQWAKILSWQIEQVQPGHVFAVGGAAEDLIRTLQSESRLPRFRVYGICHYSDRGRGRTDEAVRQDMIDGIKNALK